MAKKYDFICELYEQTCKEILSSPEKWKLFLQSACRNYKLRFDEQILVYAQRPDATAVLEIEHWNKKFGRWINRGAHGIAVFEDTARNKQRLIHYFDISDTHESRYSRPVPIWQMKPEYSDDIIKALESTFGELSDRSSLEAAILSASKNAVDDNISDYLSDLLDLAENSLSDGVSDEEIAVIYRKTVQNSVAYMLMFRLGLDTEGIFEHDDFRGAVNFTTPAMLNALGFATSDISQKCLSEVARTVIQLQRELATEQTQEYNIGINKEEQSERSLHHEENHIYNAGELQPAEPDNAGTAGGELGQIRSDEKGISQGASQNSLLQSSDELHSDRTLGRNRTESFDDGRSADEADGGEGRNHGELESGGYDVVGSENEQFEEPGAGDRKSGSNLRLVYDRSHEDKSLPFFGGDEVINEILGTTPHLKVSKDEIRAFYENTPDDTARTEYIKGIFNDDYTELILSDGRRVGYKTFENVLHLWEGSYLKRTAQSYYDWGVIAQHFEAMRLLGQLQDTIKQLPSLDGQFTLMFEAEDKKSSAFTFSQEIIDAVLTNGSGISEDKMRIYEQFEKSLSAKENADFLKEEYGWGGRYPVIVGAGIDEQHDGKGIRISKGIGDDKPHIHLTWTQVEKRIAELIRIDRYLNPKEKAVYPQWLQKQEERRAELAQEQENREILNTAPPEKEIADDPNTTPISDDDYYFHRPGVGKFEAIYYNPDATAGGQFVVLHIPYELIVKAKENSNSLREFYEYIDIRAYTELVDLGTQEFTDYLEDYAEPEPDYIGRTEKTMQALTAQAEKALGNTNKDVSYSEIKAENENSIVLYQIGDFFELYGNDAIYMSDTFSLNLTNRIVDGELVSMCGIPSNQLETYINMLTDRGNDVAVASLENNERITRTVVSTNKEDPVPSQPVGRIDYLHTDGSVRESIEYTSPYQFEKDIKEENHYGVPMALVFYKDKDGNTIPREFVEDLAPLPQGMKIIDSPYLQIGERETSPDKEIETMPAPFTPAFVQPKRSQVQSFDLHPNIPMSERHNFDLKANPVETVGKKERFRRNIAAINVLKDCEFDNRFATPDEQEILSKYVGWGGIPEVFDENNSSWADEFKELYAMLSPDEYSSARESTLTAFYTPPEVVSFIYTALEQMGLKDGNLLEPSCGIGNFIGMLPQTMENAKIYGVELDAISAGIAQQLYQKSSIAACGFEEVNVPDSFFDGIIGNVPFGDFKVLDKKYDKHNFLIHDYFFAKSLDKLRPGGVMALVTSKGTMDKTNSAVRKYIAQRADLLGAVRLPNNTFKGNAGTEVVSDILFLQKRDRLVDIEPDWVHLDTDENGIKMNSYFVQHPEMILGEMKMVNGRFGQETTCESFENSDLSELLNKATANIHGEISEYEASDNLEKQDNSILADPKVRNFSYTVLDDKIYFRENSRMTPVEVSVTAENRIKGMIGIRDCVRNLIELQTENYPDSDIKQAQEKLNRLYDDFTKKYGLINSRTNISAFRDDSSYALLSALEVLDENGELERKADLFTKRTIKPHTPITKVDTASEALAVSIGEKAEVDMEYMSKLCGKTEQEIFADLKGVIFLNPLYEYENSMEAKYLMADEYLSGNVQEKLATAKMSAEVYPEDYKINVEALEKVQPKDLTASEISVRLGATWLAPEIVQQFMFEFLSTPTYAQVNIKVHFSQFTGGWNIEGKRSDLSNVKVCSTYGTSRINAYSIIEDTLNLKDVRIFDYVEDDEGKKKAILNKKETSIAQAKQELIKQGFVDWIWQDPVRREKLTKIYNEKFNSIRPREYNGSHIVFNGMNMEIGLREHQKNAVAHILYGGNTLLAHVVGAGKTFEMVAAAQESKRLGLCNKSLFVVPNHLTEQWAAEYLHLYPAANILVATKKDFETKNRKKFCGRIATGDYDAVIIGHSQFEKIPMSIERQRAILEQQLEELTDGIIELKRNSGENFSIKQLEKSKKTIKQKLEKLNDQTRKDDVVTFEELGIDRLFVDESHYYKNLYLYTKMRNVGGIAQTEAQKSSDLFMKCHYLDEITGGRGVVFATGTPISNSMVELYTIQRYLQYNTLVENGLQHFDAWASTFGETVTALELAPEGSSYRAKTRFAKFHNLPELMQMFREAADIQTADMLKLPVPKVNYHNIKTKPSEIQTDMVAGLAKRAEKVRARLVEPNIDNMLKITNDGRRLALDQRLIDPMLPDDPTSKVNACIDNVYRIWEEHVNTKATQLVFCDLSTPKNDGSFNVYDDIREKLIARGVPAEQVRFIHEATTDAQKKELFAKVRSGEVRVLLGSTPKMGAGTNVQDRLIAIHNLDCPWRPSDLEQRQGRIERQGNMFPEVEVYRYVTEQTFDAYLYQLVESKQKFISQIMTSKSPVRSPRMWTRWLFPLRR